MTKMKSSGIKPKRSLGQNFLINEGILDKIVEAAQISTDDIVLEVGPGTGNLTRKLSEKAGRVIAIEKDRRLIEELQEKFKNTNVEIVEDDVLKLKIQNLELPSGGYKVVANIPYYITSHFLRTVFEKWPRPKVVVLTIQKEVAQRILAKPPEMNLLALSVQLYSEPKIIGYISRGSFRPMPKVDSAIIRLHPKEETGKDNEQLLGIIKAGFQGKRKQLANNLGKFGMMKEDLLGIFEKMGIRQDVRAENLSLDQWKELANYIKK